MESLKTIETLKQECIEAFQRKFSNQPTIGAAAPGRVNIIGEHTDYNDGFVLPMAIPLYTIICGRPNNTSRIRILTLANTTEEEKYVEFDCPHKSKRLQPGDPKWANYIKGVIEHFPNETIPGFDGCIATSVPLGGGLSSSASLEVSISTFLEILTGTKLNLKEKALLCQKAEHTFANMPCGIMDQFISCMGEENCALLIDCRSLTTTTVPFSSKEVSFVVINSNVKHQLSGSEYPQRRQDCFKAAEILQVKSLRDANLSLLRVKREECGEQVYQRALHVVSEIERCQKAAGAMKDGDMEELGRLMYQSHVSLRDLYQVSCPELDELVDITMQTSGVYGSRMTGGGFGGCIVVLAKTSEVENIALEVKKKYSKTPSIYCFNAVNGAHVLVC